MSTRHEIVEAVIRSRHTCKVLLPPDSSTELTAGWTAEQDAALRSMIEAAGMAPFHRRAHEQHRQGAQDSVVPWRFHVLDQASCRQLLAFLQDKAEKDADPTWSRAWQSKIKDMLAACDALIQVTWLPDPPSASADTTGTADEPVTDDASANAPILEMTDNNIEHVAAAGAAVQNLLLASEARGWLSYWSSGGILKDPRVFEHLGIASQESLLGAVFLNATVPDGAKRIPGGLREQRGTVDQWCRRVSLR